jgi:hypothetical protein
MHTMFMDCSDESTNSFCSNFVDKEIGGREAIHLLRCVWLQNGEIGSYSSDNHLGIVRLVFLKIVSN